MQVEVIRVDGNVLVFEPDDDLDSIPFGMRRETQQGMLVETQLREHTVQTIRFRHPRL